jgi:hypothetical protein
LSYHRFGARLAPLILGVAVGCAALHDPSVPQPGSVVYQRGYIDGCGSGFANANRDGYQLEYHRNEKLFATDADYHRGWSEAYLACYAEEQKAPKLIAGGPR